MPLSKWQKHIRLSNKHREYLMRKNTSELSACQNRSYVCGSVTPNQADSVSVKYCTGDMLTDTKEEEDIHLLRKHFSSRPVGSLLR